MRKAVIEAIGTYFLVLTVGLVIGDPGAGAFAPLAIGSVLMVMVYMGGHISGAHYNPAVTLAIVLRGKATPGDLLGYVLAQLVAASLAAMTVAVMATGPVAGASLEMMPALLAEFLFTFALVLVILNVATARGTEGNSYFGLAIGFTVAAGAFTVGSISGAVFNPAVGLGLVLMGVMVPTAFAAYVAIQLLAGILAALIFRSLDLGDDKPTTATPAEQADLRGAGEA